MLDSLISYAILCLSLLAWPKRLVKENKVEREKEKWKSWCLFAEGAWPTVRLHTTTCRKVKTVGDLTERERRCTRKRWRERQQESRMRHRVAATNTPLWPQTGMKKVNQRVNDVEGVKLESAEIQQYRMIIKLKKVWKLRSVTKKDTEKVWTIEKEATVVSLQKQHYRVIMTTPRVQKHDRCCRRVW